MTSRQVLARYGPLVSAALTVVGAFSAPAAVAAGVVAGMTAVGELRKKPDLDRVLKKAFQSVAQDLDHPRQQVGAEAEAVEAQVLEMCRQSRQGLLLAALGEPAEFRAALPGLDTVLMSFSGPAQHYAELVVERLGRLVHEFALSPEVYPELGQEQLKEVRAVLEGRLDGADQERADLQSQLDELRGALAALKRELDRRPSRIVEIGSMPRRAAHFVHRSDLSRVREALAGSGTATLCAVSGMRGVGKSQLAAAYARECINEGWGFVVWVSATSRAAAVAQMARVARSHGLTEEPDDEEAARWLVSWLSGTGPDPRLLVFDNVESADDLAGLIPEVPGMRVLVTTTARTDALGQRLDVDVYTLEEAVGYLVDATGNPDRDGAEAVAKALGRLPVALTQAAATVRRRGYTYLEYLEVLESQSLEGAVRRLDGDPYPVAVGVALRLAFETAIEHIRNESRAVAVSAVLVLGALALLAESGVPRSWLYQTTKSEDADREAVGALVDASILARSEDGAVVSLHRLQGRVWREDLSTDRMAAAVGTAARVLSQVDIPDDAGWEEKQVTAQALAAQLVEFLGQTYSEPVTRDSRVLGISVSAMKWCFEAGLAGLAVQLAPYTDLHERVLGRDHPGTLTTRNNLAAAYRAAGRLGEAVPLLEETLAEQERVLGRDHPSTLTTRGNLAVAYRAAGRLGEAAALLEEVLADHVRVLGRDHPGTLTTRGNLALAYRAAGRLGEAVPLLEEVLADHVRLLGPDHPDTLTIRGNLAGAYRDAGRLGEAVPLFEEVLADHVRVLGRDHPGTLTSRGNLAGAYRDAGRLGEAVPLLEETLADHVRVLGPDHPGTLTSRSNLAVAYRDAGRLGEAVPLLEGTLADRVRVLGPDHPGTLTSRGNLAGAYWEAGRLGEAVPLLEETLADRVRVLGPDHPDTLTSRGNLAGAYRDAGRLGEAVPLLEETLADHVRVLGPDHPDTLTSRNNLAGAYWEAGRLGEAVPLLEETLADCERVLGRDHPDTLTSRGNLAAAYWEAGRLGEAVPLFEEVLADHVRVLGPDHPGTLTTRGNLAGAYRDAGRLGEAVPLFEEVLADHVRVLGPDHPGTLTSRGNLAGAYRDAGRLGEAVPLFEEVLAESVRVLGPDHPDTLTSRRNLVAAYLDQKEWGKAILLVEQVIRDGGTIPGPDLQKLLEALKRRAAEVGAEGESEPEETGPDQDG